ncbi:unnamed protein product [Vitrella brassicaformis CCMP3155]|uniref:Cyclin N-terminal domain-containing protein n=1 Tax=Vitrella brassicaformis (strain CCMP3155) TaxID=1169540 RepID=A0A0G4H2H9_VITBC|nr:unnamed protein product [Vitrella brassicaformis CCMP3155]|eukprot:CEM37830.1 unnamed protein product [Vitrella brassicaformis CCMP3155]
MPKDSNSNKRGGSGPTGPYSKAKEPRKSRYQLRSGRGSDEFLQPGIDSERQASRVAKELRQQLQEQAQKELKELQQLNAKDRDLALGNGAARLKSLSPDLTNQEMQDGHMMSQYPSLNLAHGQGDKYALSVDFLSNCGDAFKELRGYVVDRILDGCSRMCVWKEALPLAVRLLDYYIHTLWTKGENLFHHNLVAVGYTCLLIASKYEEREPVVINDLVTLMNEVPMDKGDRTYTRVDFLRIEQHILMTTGMELPSSTYCAFSDRFAKAGGIPPDTKDHAFVQFLQELALTDYTFSQYKSNIISAAAVYTTRKMWLLMEGQPRHGEDSWTEALKRVTGLQKSQLMPCYKEMSRLLRSLNRPHIAIGKQDACIAKWSTPANYKFASAFYD